MRAFTVSRFPIRIPRQSRVAAAEASSAAPGRALAPSPGHNDNGAATRGVAAPLDRAAEGGKTAC